MQKVYYGASDVDSRLRTIVLRLNKLFDINVGTDYIFRIVKQVVQKNYLRLI